jgi:hypothetical protein
MMTFYAGVAMNASFLSLGARYARIGVMLFTTVLAGCASTLSTRVTSFQQWPANAAGQTYHFVPVNPAQADNLEYRSYQDMVRAAIGSTGLIEAQAGAPVRFAVSFDYGAEQTQGVVRRAYDPYFYGPPGFYGPPWGYGRYYGVYGGYWGPEWVDVPVIRYRDFLNLQIRDVSHGNTEVYRSSAYAFSSHPDILNIMPYLVHSVFDNFPGNSGSQRVIEYKLGN